MHSKSNHGMAGIQGFSCTISLTLVPKTMHCGETDEQQSVVVRGKSLY